MNISEKDGVYAVLINQNQLNDLVADLVKKEVDKILDSVKPDYSPDQRITIDDICELYRISRPTVHAQMHKGLKFEKIGRKTVFNRQDVDEWFKAGKGAKQ
jgi:excisionase family DNA binding protein